MRLIISRRSIENAEPGTYTIQVTHKGALLEAKGSLIADGQTTLQHYFYKMISVSCIWYK
jgi:hypothetical protein